MCNHSRQAGLSLVELLIGLAVLSIGFGAAVQLMGTSRKSLKSAMNSGHQIHFETFASSRIRFYFSKILQWTTHLGGDQEDKSQMTKRVYRNYCKETRNFAYATAPLPFEDFTPEIRRKVKLKERKDGSVVVVTKKDKTPVYEENEDGDPVFVQFDTKAGKYTEIADPDDESESGVSLLDPSDKFINWVKNHDKGDTKKVYLNKIDVVKATLAADMRMALSTLNYEQTRAWDDTGLLDKYDENSFLWGAMVPFGSGASTNDSLARVNPNLQKYCSDTKYKPTSGAGKEMCDWVSWCSSSNRDENPNKDDVKLLEYSEGAKNSVNEFYGQSKVRMCFAFVGNLFSRTGTFYEAAKTSSSNGLNPAVLGFAVATARIVNIRNDEELICQNSIYNMFRQLKVDLMLYSVFNADKEVKTNEQVIQKTLRDFTSEKLGVERPNCKASASRLRVNMKNSTGAPICIGDPLLHFTCSGDFKCGPPD